LLNKKLTSFLSLVTLIVFPDLNLHSQSIGSNNVELLSQLNPIRRPYSDIWGYTDSQDREYVLMGELTGTIIVEVTDPRNPGNVILIPGPSTPWRDFKTFSHYAYVISEARGTGRGLQIIDLSNLPASAQLVTTYSTTVTNAHNLYIDDGYAYVVGTQNANGGIHILDLSNPESPVEVGVFSRNYVHDVFVRDNIAYASALDDGLQIIDVSNKSNPTIITSIRYANSVTHNAWLTDDSNYVLTTDEEEGGHLKIWDIRDLNNITLARDHVRQTTSPS